MSSPTRNTVAASQGSPSLGELVSPPPLAGQSKLDRIAYVAAISSECLIAALRPSSWRRPVRSRFSRQILFSGVESVSFTIFAGLLLGAITTMKSTQILIITGELDFLAPLICILFVREGAPFFALVITICASASAITSEVSTMRLSGEVDLIESQGVNAIQFVILPRAVGLALTAAGLSLIFVTAAMLAAAATVILSGRILAAPFIGSILQSISFPDIVNLLGRSSIAAFLSGVLCCYEGLTVQGAAATMVPQAVTRAMLGSIAITLIISALFAVTTYTS